AGLVASLADLVDLRDLGDAVRLRATQPDADRLRERLRQLRGRFTSPLLLFTGSGDYHHVALLLLATLAADSGPYTLVLIDNHPDWFRESPPNHCGNWVASALDLPQVGRAVLVGQNSPDLRWHRFYHSPFESLCDGRLTLHPFRLASRRIPLRWPACADNPARFTRHAWGTTLRFQPCDRADQILHRLATELAGQRVYVSIDKDCLTPRDATTDWEHGGFSLDGLCLGLRELASSCQLVGADICGDKAPDPLTGFWRRLDAGRLRHHPHDRAAAARINEIANLALLGAFGPTDAEVPA
ncbi:MAG: hypothetical protein ABSH20_28980, partial [Tepidisphaeraceae bacterium]